MTDKTDFWIDNPEQPDLNPGDLYFLIEKSNTINRWHRHELRLTPPKTNQSFQYRIHGWCGTYNDISTYGSGIVQITQIAKNGRVQLHRLTEDSDKFDFQIRSPIDAPKITRFLEETGFDEFTWTVADLPPGAESDIKDYYGK